MTSQALPMPLPPPVDGELSWRPLEGVELVEWKVRAGAVLDQPDVLAALGFRMPRRILRWRKHPLCRDLVRALYARGVKTRTIALACDVNLGLVTKWTVDIPRNKRGAVYPRGAEHPGSLAKKEPAIVQAIRERWREGESLAAIKRGLEIGRSTVARYVADLPRARSKPGPTKESHMRPRITAEKIEAVRNAYAAGKPYKQIAAEVGVGIGTVIKYTSAIRACSPRRGQPRPKPATATPAPAAAQASED